MLRKYALVIVSFLLLTSSISTAKEYKSTQIATNTMELFTSEGCSSCPPADKWVSKLLKDKTLFTYTIPLVFHIDYWDYIGWKDIYASQSNTLRQRQHKIEGRSSGVYTPEFIVNNKEWKAWFNPFTREWGKSTKTVGKLTLNHHEESDILDITFNPQVTSTTGYKLHVAVLGMGIKSEIKKGENRGETLIHDFVVLKHKAYSPQRQTTWRVPMLDIPHLKQKENAIVVLISPGDSQEIIQSVGGYL